MRMTAPPSFRKPNACAKYGKKPRRSGWPWARFYSYEARLRHPPERLRLPVRSRLPEQVSLEREPFSPSTAFCALAEWIKTFSRSPLPFERAWRPFSRFRQRKRSFRNSRFRTNRFGSSKMPCLHRVRFPKPPLRSLSKPFARYSPTSGRTILDKISLRSSSRYAESRGLPAACRFPIRRG